MCFITRVVYIRTSGLYLCFLGFCAQQLCAPFVCPSACALLVKENSSSDCLCCCCVFVCACGHKKGTGLKDDRRLEQKSNHLIATFFISIFSFMAAEGRRATLAVIHGCWGGR